MSSHDFVLFATWEIYFACRKECLFTEVIHYLKFIMLNLSTHDARALHDSIKYQNKSLQYTGTQGLGLFE